MRILWLKSDLLLPLDKGGKLRTWHLLRHLTAWHDITYEALQADPEFQAVFDHLVNAAARKDAVTIAAFIDGPRQFAAVQTYVTLQSTGASGASIPNIGASGAIAGVLGAYIVLFPRARVVTLIVVILRELPASWFLGIWFIFQIVDGGLSLKHPQSGGGTAFFAHVGGFVFGALTVLLVRRRPPLRPAY